MQSLGDTPLQVKQVWSQGKQYPSSVPSAICLVSCVPAGHVSTHVLSSKAAQLIQHLLRCLEHTKVPLNVDSNKFVLCLETMLLL